MSGGGNNNNPRYDSSAPPIPKPSPIPNPNPNLQTVGLTPSYGFHMLERRSLILADGSVRSYLALPPNYENFNHFRPDVNRKRKFGEDELDLDRQRQQLLQYGNVNGPGSSSSSGFASNTKTMRIHHQTNINNNNNNNNNNKVVDQKAFLHFVKLVFESGTQKKNYLADGKQGTLTCLACSGRSSKNFPDAHSLVMHAYTIESADSVVDHLAFHKALCVLMGWNYLMPPDNSKAYQKLSAHDAEATQDDLIMWPPSVLILNTTTGKGKEGRMEGLGNRAMDAILKDLGFTSGKSMSMYSREGHTGIHVVKFSMDESGLKDAMRMADYFEREKRGRKAWAQVQSSTHGKDDENNPNIMKLDPKTGEKKRVFYGHLATVADLDKVTFEIKKKVSIVSRKAYRESK